MIQLIEKQPGKYTLKINGLVCVFMPMCLFCGRSIIPLKPFVPKGKSVIKWKVSGKQVSYNQIKKAIKTTTNEVVVDESKIGTVYELQHLTPVE